MLVEFSVGNYLSFKDIVTFSMISSNIKQHTDTHVFESQKYKLLKNSAIYGANASGKSNLFKAMKFAQWFIIKSSKDMQAKESINVERFALSSETEDKPSFFEFIFIQNNIKYRYGFKADKEKIVEEWLFSAEKIKEKELFIRNYQDIKVTKSFEEGSGLESKTRKNALFLSVVAQFNGKISESLIDWLHNFNIVSGMDNYYTLVTLEKLDDEKFEFQFFEILQIADLAIDFIRFTHNREKESDYNAVMLELLNPSFKDSIGKRHRKIDKYEFIDPASEPFPDIKTSHKKFDKDNNEVGFVDFELEKQESEGTKKLFSILGPIIDTLNAGSILVVDELDVKIHPLITQFIVKMFNSNKQNPNNAQLIFNTHDTNLLNKEIFRRDQIWFTEKDEYGSTDLYSLMEYKFEQGAVRADRTFAKDYLAGKYGAIPFVGTFDFFCKDE